MRSSLAHALAAEIALDGNSAPPRPRLLEALRVLVQREWFKAAGVVAIVEELICADSAHRIASNTLTTCPFCMHFLDTVAEVTPASKLLHALAGAPVTRALLVQSTGAALARFPHLLKLQAAGTFATLGGETREGALAAEAKRAEGLMLPVESDDVVFEAAEDYSTGWAERALTAYAILATCLPPVGVPSIHTHHAGACDAGLLLGGHGGVLEEWDMDAVLRLDSLNVAGEDCSPNITQALDVVALMTPSIFAQAGEPDEVVVAVVNSPTGSGLAVLRRYNAARAWQVEVPWPPHQSWESSCRKQLLKLSRGEFMHGSISSVVVGETTALGSFEVGLYDVTTVPPRPLATCSQHTNLVADVCALTAQTCASASLDGTSLLWDVRAGPSAVARAACQDDEFISMAGLCSVAGSGMLLMCGSLAGELFLFDSRKLCDPVARPPSVGGAAVRIQLWSDVRTAGAGNSVLAAVLSSEEGLCSARFNGATCDSSCCLQTW